MVTRVKRRKPLSQWRRAFNPSPFYRRARRNPKLIHAGRVGTGFTNKVAADLFRRLDPMAIPKSRFAKKLSAEEARRVRFVRPKLVAEVDFRTWTADRPCRRRLRHQAESPRDRQGHQPCRASRRGEILRHPRRLSGRQCSDAERDNLRRSCAEIPFKAGQTSFSVPCSLGVSCCVDGSDSG